MLVGGLVVAADAFWIVFRFVHIISGILWAGSAFFLFVFVGPTVEALGPDGGRFIGHMVERRKMARVILSLAGLTVFGGVVLYLKVSSGLDPDWIGTAPGIGFTIGAVAAIVAFVMGVVAITPTIHHLTELGGRIQTATGPPAPEDLETLQRLTARFKVLGKADIVLIFTAAAAMATARYW
jgi:uncharacterized membrane protein